MATIKATEREMQALLSMARLVYETVRDYEEGGGIYAATGCPEGPIYAALQGHLSLDNYSRLIEATVALGVLERRQSHCLHANVEKAREIGFER